MHGGRFSRAGNCGFRGQEELSSGTIGEFWGRGKEMSFQVKKRVWQILLRVYQAPLPFPSGNTSCLVAITWGYVIVFSLMD